MGFWKDLMDVALHAAEAAAIVIGGWWTYFNFLRGRTYKPKLAINIRGAVYPVGTAWYLDILVSVKNIGRSKFDVAETGTALIISEPSRLPPQDNIMRVVWEPLGTYVTLDGQSWIEPDEEVEDRLLVLLPARHPSAYRVEAHVASESLVWKASTIVYSFQNKLVELRRGPEGGSNA